MYPLGHYRCSECGHQAINRKALATHVAKEHTDNAFRCDHCDFVTKYQANFWRHKKTLHGLQSINICRPCGSRFPTKDALVDHTRQDHPELLDEVLEKISRSLFHEESIATTATRRRRSVVAPPATGCATTVADSVALPPEPDSPPREENRYDIGAFLDEDEGVSSIENILEQEFTELSREKPIGHRRSSRRGIHVQRSHLCQDCEFATKDSREFLVHRKEVHGERLTIYDCPWCHYASRQLQKLQRHCASCHVGIEPGITADDVREAIRRVAQNTHEAAKLAKEDIIIAGYFGKNSSTNQKLPHALEKTVRLPVVAASGSEPSSSSASAQGFNSKHRYSNTSYQLKHFKRLKHLKRLKQLGGQWYTCRECAFKARSRKIVTDHERTSHGIEPPRSSPAEFAEDRTSSQSLSQPQLQFRCNICGFACRDVVKYRQHVKVHHSAVGASCSIANSNDSRNDGQDDNRQEKDTLVRLNRYASSGTAAPAASPRDRSERVVHQCNKCDFASIYRWSLDRHVKYHGPFNGELHCDRCDYSSNQAGSLRFHVNNHHQGVRASLEAGVEPSDDGGDCDGIDGSDSFDGINEQHGLARQDINQRMLNLHGFALNDVARLKERDIDEDCGSCDDRENQRDASRTSNTKLEMMRQTSNVAASISVGSLPGEMEGSFIGIDEVNNGSQARESGTCVGGVSCDVCGACFLSQAALLDHSRKEHMNVIEAEQAQMFRNNARGRAVGGGQDEALARLQNRFGLVIMPVEGGGGDNGVDVTTVMGARGGAAAESKQPVVIELGNGKSLKHLIEGRDNGGATVSSAAVSSHAPAAGGITSKPAGARSGTIFKCRYCPYSTRVKQEYQRHEHIHKPIACQLCSYKTVWKHDLTKHMFKQHGIESGNSSAVSVSSAGSVAGTVLDSVISAPSPASAVGPLNAMSLPPASGGVLRNLLSTPELMAAATAAAAAAVGSSGSGSTLTTGTNESLLFKTLQGGTDSPLMHLQQKLSGQQETSNRSSFIQEESQNSALRLPANAHYFCPYCDFTTKTASRFHIHYMQHLNVRPFECSVCRIKSNWLWDINKHIRTRISKGDLSHQSAKCVCINEAGLRDYSKYRCFIKEGPANGEHIETPDEAGEAGVMASQGQVHPAYASTEAQIAALAANRHRQQHQQPFSQSQLQQQLATAAATTGRSLVASHQQQPSHVVQTQLASVPVGQLVLSGTGNANAGSGVAVTSAGGDAVATSAPITSLNTSNGSRGNSSSSGSGVDSAGRRAFAAALQQQAAAVVAAAAAQKARRDDAHSNYMIQQLQKKEMLRTAASSSSTVIAASGGPLKCGHCEYSCDHKDIMLGHLGAHADVLPFICSKCGLANKWHHTAWIHLQQFHRDQQVTLKDIHLQLDYRQKGEVFEMSDPSLIVNPVLAAAPAPEASLIRQLRCSRCPYHTVQKSNMQRHREGHMRLRPDLMRYKCPYCDFWQETRRAIQRHMGLHPQHIKRGTQGVLDDTCGAIASGGESADSATAAPALAMAAAAAAAVAAAAATAAGGGDAVVPPESTDNTGGSSNGAGGDLGDVSGGDVGGDVSSSVGDSVGVADAVADSGGNEPLSVVPSIASLARKILGDVASDPSAAAAAVAAAAVAASRQAASSNPASTAVSMLTASQAAVAVAAVAGENTPSSSSSSSDLLTNAPKYRCDSCPYETTTNSQFIYHKQFHRYNPKAKFKCDKCSYWATHAHLITQHAKVHQTGMPDQKFPEGSWLPPADIVATTESNTSDRIRAFRVLKDGTMLKMYKCRFCSLMNRKKSNVRYHELLHNDKATGRYTCHLCSYRTLSREDLGEHMRIHVPLRSRRDDGGIELIQEVDDGESSEDDESNSTADASSDATTSDATLGGTKSSSNSSKPQPKIKYNCSAVESELFNLLQSRQNGGITSMSMANSSNEVERSPSVPRSSPKVNQQCQASGQSASSQTKPKKLDRPPADACMRRGDGLITFQSTVNLRKWLACPECPALFMNPTEYTRHLDHHHFADSYRCTQCSYSMNKFAFVAQHELVHTEEYMIKKLGYCHRSAKGCGDHETSVKEGFIKPLPSIVNSNVPASAGAPAGPGATSHTQSPASSTSSTGNSVSTKSPPKPQTLPIKKQPLQSTQQNVNGVNCTSSLQMALTEDASANYASEEYSVALMMAELHESKAVFDGVASGQFKCGNCPAVFVNQAVFRFHVALHNATPVHRLKCHMCSYSIDEPANMAAHAQLHYSRHPSLKPTVKHCPKCPATFTKQNFFEGHLLRHGSGERYRCEQCDFATNKSDIISRHRMLHRQSDEPENKISRFGDSENVSIDSNTQLAMSTLFRSAAVPQSLVNNNSTSSDRGCNSLLPMEAVIRPPSLTMLEDEKRVFACTACPYTHTRKDGLQYHLKRHIVRQALECPHCSFSVANPATLRDHIKVHFSAPRVYKPQAFLHYDDFKIKLCQGAADMQTEAGIRECKNGMAGEVLLFEDRGCPESTRFYPEAVPNLTDDIPRSLVEFIDPGIFSAVHYILDSVCADRRRMEREVVSSTIGSAARRRNSLASIRNPLIDGDSQCSTPTVDSRLAKRQKREYDNPSVIESGGEGSPRSDDCGFSHSGSSTPCRKSSIEDSQHQQPQLAVRVAAASNEDEGDFRRKDASCESSSASSENNGDDNSQASSGGFCSITSHSLSADSSWDRKDVIKRTCDLDMDCSASTNKGRTSSEYYESTSDKTRENQRSAFNDTQTAISSATIDDQEAAGKNCLSVDNGKRAGERMRFGNGNVLPSNLDRKQPVGTHVFYRQFYANERNLATTALGRLNGVNPIQNGKTAGLVQLLDDNANMEGTGKMFGRVLKELGPQQPREQYDAQVVLNTIVCHVAQSVTNIK